MSFMSQQQSSPSAQKKVYLSLPLSSLSSLSFVVADKYALLVHPLTI